jgi:predicted nucleotidyltransferase
MRRAEVLRMLAEHRNELERLGVASLTLFGSVARDEAGPDSDVDLLVELKRPMGLFEFFAIRDRIEAILGVAVDLGMPDALKPRVRERASKDAVRAL